MLRPNEFAVNLFNERRKTISRNVFEIYECFQQYFFFTSSCLLSAASFCIFNGQHSRIKLCEMADRVHKSEYQIKYLIYDTKVLTVCAVNYGVMASMVFNK